MIALLIPAALNRSDQPLHLMHCRMLAITHRFVKSLPPTIGLKPLLHRTLALIFFAEVSGLVDRPDLRKLVV